MVRIAIAGSSGEVAREIISVLHGTGRHEILLMSRKVHLLVCGIGRVADQRSPAESLPSGIRWCQVGYADVDGLKEALSGVHTVLSFITPQTDHDNQAQRNLIDACVSAGVKRFAPSEWATSSFEHMPWYSGKQYIRDFLARLNKDGKVLEYSLFQPGLFLNYLTHPYKSAEYVSTFQTQIDLHNRRAIVPETFQTDKITLTTVQDLAHIVTKAVEYEGEWPVNGGIQGCEMSVAQLIRLCEQIRGTFQIDRLTLRELEAGIIKSSWSPKVDHPAITPEESEQMGTMFLAGMTLGISAGALNVSNEWNQIFPDYGLTQPHEFLTEVWKDRP